MNSTGQRAFKRQYRLVSLHQCRDEISFITVKAKKHKVVESIQPELANSAWKCPGPQFQKKNFFLSSQNSFGKSLQKSNETFFSPILTFIFTTDISIPSKHLHQSVRHSIWPSISNPCFSYDYLRNFTCVFKSLLQLIKCLLYNPLISKTTNSLETKWIFNKFRTEFKDEFNRFSMTKTNL